MPFKIRKRGKELKNWYVDRYVPSKVDPNHIHINRSTRTADYDEACRIEDEWIAEAEELYLRRSGELSSANDVKVSDALEWMTTHHWNSVLQYQQISECIRWMGDVPLAELAGHRGNLMLSRLQEDLLGTATKTGGRPREKTTVDRYMSALKTLLNKAPKGMGIQDFTVPDVPFYKVDRKRKRMLQDDEEKKLFDTITDPLFADFCRVLLDTGLRVSEALSLDYRKNIDTQRGELRGVKTLKKRGFEYRTLPMTKKVLKIFKRLRQEGKHKPFGCWVGTRCAQMFQLVRIRMGLADDHDFVLHMLRHTCATRLLIKGMGIAEVSKWLGHSSVVQTERYLQLTSSHIHHGADLLDSYDEEVSRLDEVRALQSISKDKEIESQKVPVRDLKLPNDTYKPTGRTQCHQNY